MSFVMQAGLGCSYKPSCFIQKSNKKIGNAHVSYGVKPLANAHDLDNYRRSGGGGGGCKVDPDKGWVK